MIEIIGLMVATYGICRLVQTTLEADRGLAQIAGLAGAAALIVLAILLHEQAGSIGPIR